MSPVPAKTGLLLVGHGTRSRQGAEEFLALAARVASELPAADVEPAFLELSQPTIDEALSRVARRGVRRVVALPLMLFAAGHVKRDIPAAVEAAARRLGSPQLGFAYANHLGCAEPVLELSRQRFAESIQGCPAVPAERTCLLLVGRGSHDDSATAQMHHFAELWSARSASGPLGRVAVAFIAMARPAVRDVLPQLAAQSWQRIVVQPHLLFHGELNDRLRQEVQAIAAKNVQQEWIVTPYLAAGLSPSDQAGKLLVETVLQRFQAAAIRVVAPGGDG